VPTFANAGASASQLRCGFHQWTFGSCCKAQLAATIESSRCGDIGDLSGSGIGRNITLRVANLAACGVRRRPKGCGSVPAASAPVRFPSGPESAGEGQSRGSHRTGWPVAGSHAKTITAHRHPPHHHPHHHPHHRHPSHCGAAPSSTATSTVPLCDRRTFCSKRSTADRQARIILRLGGSRVRHAPPGLPGRCC
jgi:hypothetical protein